MGKVKADRIDFFCLGAQKAGTTLLHDILKQHQDIYLPTEKEAHFFDVNEVYYKGLIYYFSTYFDTYSGEKVIGNINPNLQIEKRSIDRIIDNFGTNIKVLFLLRNPVNRAYSHYLMSRKRGYEKLGFLEAIKKEPIRISNSVYHKGYESKEKGHFEKNHYGYISRGLYSEMLKYVFEKFPEENVRIYVFEELLADKENTIKDILTFLGIEQQNLNFDLKSNSGQKAVSFGVSKFLNTPSILKDTLKFFIPKTFRRSLKRYVYNKNLKPLSVSEKKRPYDYLSLKQQFFLEDIKQLEQILGRKIEVWE